MPPRSLLLSLLLAVAEPRRTAAKGLRHGGCPSRCHCEADGARLRVDCSDLGLTALPANLSQHHLCFSLSSLWRLAGNGLTHIPEGAFSGLGGLKVLMLQNNQLQRVPCEALQNLRNLQSFRLDANHIHSAPPGCFHGLVSLRHLWLDDNALTEVPVQALAELSSLQAMTLALNKIRHIPDHAFANLSSLVVLHLHNNKIHSLGEKCFDGLRSLETLDLNYNSLLDFPFAIKALTNLKELSFHSNNIRSIPEKAFTGNPSLQMILFYDNPIKFVGKSAFQHLPELRMLSLNRASEITEFPDLTGTTSLESLTITRARLSSLPGTLCDHLTKLQVLDLSYNIIQDLPSFSSCRKIQKIDLHHNEILEVRAGTFQGLMELRSLDLSWNRVRSVEPHAFADLPLLSKLDLSSNALSSLPTAGLGGLTHLKLSGNGDLRELMSAEDFPKLRVMEMPYAFQCCAFVACERSAKLWDTEESSGRELQSRRDADIAHVLNRPEGGSSIWIIRCAVWIIVVLSLVCNGLVAATIFLSPAFVSPAKHLIGLLAIINSLMGLSSGMLAVVDALTFGSFAQYGAWWENGMGCKITGFLSVFAGETCVFLLTTATLEQDLSARSSKSVKTGASSMNNIKAISALCFSLALVITVLPLLHIGEYGVSSLCLPLPFGEPSSLGFMVALVLLNLLCYFVMTFSYTRLSLGKGEMVHFMESSMIKHVACLLFTNCLLYFPMAFLSFCSLLSLSFISPEVAKSILLLIVPLPACLNPLLYILFNPHFKEDLCLLLKWTNLLKDQQHSSLVSVSSEDAEKQSCDSSQALVTSEVLWPSVAWFLTVPKYETFPSVLCFGGSPLAFCL
uniref:Leucine rich repeat containing G protein-coupled receptor 5 n=1 Tax=Scleropages formosus TaxID=113540 RepID=A0A8C9U124_SCLFO